MCVLGLNVGQIAAVRLCEKEMTMKEMSECHNGTKGRTKENVYSQTILQLHCSMITSPSISFVSPAFKFVSV